jgi:hypothetical protein
LSEHSIETRTLFERIKDLKNIDFIDKFKNLFKKSDNNNNIKSYDSGKLEDIYNNFDSYSNKSIELIDQTKRSTPSIEKYLPLDKGKGISEGELSELEISRRALSPQLTGLLPIKENNFEDASNALLAEIEQYNKYYNNSKFPKVELKEGLYNVIRERLLKLSETNNDKYNSLIQNDEVNDKINSFIKLEKDVFKYEDVLSSNGSNTYNEIALATIQEQDA